MVRIKEKQVLNEHEKTIIKVLFDEKRPLSIKKISSISGMSWVTVRKYIRSLVEKRVVMERKTAKRKKWVLDFDKL